MTTSRMARAFARLDYCTILSNLIKYFRYILTKKINENFTIHIFLNRFFNGPFSYKYLDTNAKHFVQILVMYLLKIFNQPWFSLLSIILIYMQRNVYFCTLHSKSVKFKLFMDVHMIILCVHIVLYFHQVEKTLGQSCEVDI
jgi:hypothetical protein